MQQSKQHQKHARQQLRPGQGRKAEGRGVGVFEMANSLSGPIIARTGRLELEDFRFSSSLEECILKNPAAQVCAVRTGEFPMPESLLPKAPPVDVTIDCEANRPIENTVARWGGVRGQGDWCCRVETGELLFDEAGEPVMEELDEEGKLKMYSFCGSFVNDNTDTPEEDMDRIAQEAKEYNGKHVKVIGAKVFADGVVEGHSAWMLDDYVDKPGYKGVRRFDDHDKMVRLVKAAAAHGMNVHVHSVGDGATRAWIDAFAQAQAETGNFDMRNALAHLQEMTPEDVKRMGEYNVMAVCGIMWAVKHPAGFAQEVAYVGEEKSNNAYPVKSIMDAGGVVANHSDYPVSPLFSAVQAFCYGVLKKLPSDPDDYIRNIDQAISRHEALKTLTSNVAYMWHEEDRMGSISVGKLANFAVLDRDFMHDDFAEIEKAVCLATIVDGDVVYKA